MYIFVCMCMPYVCIYFNILEYPHDNFFIEYHGREF
jgi:hypothetical protein